MRLLRLEFKKLSPRLLWWLVIGFPVVPALITLLAILMLANGAAGCFGLRSQAVGLWAVFLYPLLCIILTQSLINVERQHNLINYARSFRRDWYGWLFRKVVVVGTVLLGATALNIVFDSLLFWYEYPILSPGEVLDFSGYLVDAYGSVAVACLPLICFHLLISILLPSPGLGYTVGLLGVIGGLLLLSVTQLPINPYTLPLLVVQQGGLGLELIVPLLLIIGLSVLGAETVLRRTSI